MQAVDCVRAGWFGILAVVASLMASSLAPGPVLAQDAATNAYLSPEETRVCICLEEEVDGMSVELEASKQARESVAAEFARLDALVEQARATIDVNDQAETDSFRRLFNRREELRQELNSASRPFDQVVGRYNKVAQTYNSRCANRKMFKVNVDAARANLQCGAAQ